MAEISMNEAVLFLQMESVEGVLEDAYVPSDAVVIKDFSAEPVTGNRKERNLVRPYFGANPGVLTGAHGTMKFATEAAGAGVAALDAGEAPAFGKLLRAGGYAQTILAPAATIAASPPTPSGAPTGTFTYAAGDPYQGVVNRLVTLTCTLGGASGVAVFDVTAPAIKHLAAYSSIGQVMTDATPFALAGGATITPTVGTDFVAGDIFTIQLTSPGSFYVPVSNTFESASAAFHYGVNRHEYLGLRGNPQLSITADDYFNFTFDTMAKIGTRSHTALPDVDFSLFQTPLVVSDDNTPWVSLNGIEIVMRSMTPNTGQNLTWRSLVGRQAAKITDRSMQGQFVFEALDLDDADFFASLQDGDILPFSLIHGLTRGQIVDIDMPRLQLTSLTYQDEDGTAMIGGNYVALPSDAGNDEVTIGIK